MENPPEIRPVLYLTHLPCLWNLSLCLGPLDKLKKGSSTFLLLPHGLLFGRPSSSPTPGSPSWLLRLWLTSLPTLLAHLETPQHHTAPSPIAVGLSAPFTWPAAPTLTLCNLSSYGGQKSDLIFPLLIPSLGSQDTR